MRHLLILFILIMAAPVYAGTLLDFNDPGTTSTNWTGYTWYSGAGGAGADDYGRPGWRKNDGTWYSGYGNNWLPRTQLKNDYGNANLATMDAANRAPSTSTGAALKVYDTGGSSTHQASWYFIWPDNFKAMGLAGIDDTTNRADMYFKMTGVDALTTDPEIEPPNYNVHFATFSCWPGGGPSGESCPIESSNGHYYHYLTASPDMWLHVQFDNHPDIQRGPIYGVGNDPTTYYGSTHHYYASMWKFYVEIRYPQTPLTTMWVDELRFWTQTQAENTTSITSPWIGYNTSTGKWDVGFNDLSFALPRGSSLNLSGTTQSSFEIRWSTSPITNANWATATTITPELWRRGATNTFVRCTTWKDVAWTRFSLPAGTETNNDLLYFAIKDVSSVAAGDGHAAASNNVRTIDYALRPNRATDTTAPTTTASVLTGTYTTAQAVELTPDETATTYYTLDGTTPTTASAVYATALNISASRTLKYFSRDLAGNSEAVQTQVYTIDTSAINIGITTWLTGSQPGYGGWITFQPATLAESADIQSISIFANVADGAARLGIYDDTGPDGGPGALLAFTDELSVTAGTLHNGWTTASVTNPVTLAAGTYYLAYLLSTDGFLVATDGGALTLTYYSYPYAALPATAETTTPPLATITARVSFYASLTALTVVPAVPVSQFSATSAANIR